VIACAVSFACGAKRPPAVAVGDPGAAPPASQQATEPGGQLPGQVVEAGPDVRPLESEEAFGEDMGALGSNPEGGPLEDIRFHYDSAALSEEAKLTLDKNAQWLKSHPSAYVMIEGHCDERGTVDYNLALGDQRARAARDQLVALGIAAERLATASFGKERPLDFARTEAAYARNRRAHFAVSRGPRAY
jgi:peptidoglycan-associated lipoprotein